ncbi:TPM domain-containing protein [Thermomonas sp.]|uniref:TPM domain-containing protein n=1 Tax=Thermomonas sp. TaxID=1971895 RepID=UPI0024870D04|nr:TPM domain-containing protein [Thermomonas sp.]MDI1254395.1 TPM domain-containing protein [Thermomonas sp.]
MAATLTRLLRHLCQTDARTRFPAADMDRIAAAIGEGERRHRGEICFAVESTLPWWEVLRGIQARAKAEHAFGRLRVWDTAANNGVLVYLLLADHHIEIVADRGLSGLVSDAQWQGVCQLLEERLRNGDHADAVIAAISGVSDLLAQHYPPLAGTVDEDELPDRPVFL